MKTRIAILIAIVALLLVGSVALRRAPSGALAQSSGPPALAGYTVKPGAASGGQYRLTSTSWRVSGASGGGRYHLLGPASPSSDNQCCYCGYLPCVLRNH